LRGHARCGCRDQVIVMAALVAAIHAFLLGPGLSRVPEADQKDVDHPDEPGDDGAGDDDYSSGIGYLAIAFAEPDSRAASPGMTAWWFFPVEGAFYL
jgi:hypothetical protein